LRHWRDWNKEQPKRILRLLVAVIVFQAFISAARTGDGSGSDDEAARIA
jgi:hypothetical protein